MTKTFTLLLLFIGNIFLSYSKSKFQLIEFNASSLNNSTANKLNTSDFRYNQTDYFVIQPVINSQDYLIEKGLTIESYLGNGFYFVSVNNANAFSVLQSIESQKTGYLSSDSKIDESLKSISTVQPVTVLFASSLNETMLHEITQQTGISIVQTNSKFSRFYAIATLNQLNELAKFPFILHITKYYPNKNSLITDGSQMLGVNQVSEVQPFGYNLKGDGINVGIWDDGAVGAHVDLPVNTNFVIEKERNDLLSMTHTTEVAGSLGGSGNIFSSFRGVASNSSKYYWDLLNDIVNEIDDAKKTYSVDITNHSYNFAATNCFQSGLYIPEASDLDKLVYNNPVLLPVVAVGNSASANCAIASDTFYSVDIGFQGCKNALTVGWLFSNEKIVENSGRGPTEDGRIKPELVAKGFQVTTLSPNNGFSTVFGSSFSAPFVSGIAALLHQKYKQQFGLFPQASLIKAILLNTARDLGNAGPDYTFGFGKPDANRAVESIANNFYFEDNIQNNSLKSHSITVPANCSQLKITLSWTDKEGNPVADKTIVNNLDLKLVTTTGDTILPWKLNPSLPKNIALRGIDNVNTNEQITINNPVAGTYTIVVKGTSVPFGPQNYSVAYFNQNKKIELTYPNGGEIIDLGTVQRIRWFANSIDSLAKIEFSSNNGNTWETVTSNIQLSTQGFNWTIPNEVSNQCLIKITSGNNSDVSFTPFSIGSQIFYPSINHTVCDKTVKINWPAVTGATGYKVYLFSDTIWNLITQTSLLTHTINNLVNGKSYMYAISTIVNGFEGNKSLANSFTTFPIACTTLNDVGVYALTKSTIGRKFTSSALTSTQKLSFILKNYGTTAQNSISVSYRINGGTIRTSTLSEIMISNDTAIINFNVNEDLSATGIYNILAWTNLPGDVNTNNDTLKTVIKHLANLPLTLPFSESFESVNENLTYQTFGINGMEYADYYAEEGGRFRSNEGNLFANTGNRGITLDNYIQTAQKKNDLIFTYNLSNYVDSIIFLDFSYMNRAESDSNDIIFARGDDTKPWVRIYNLFDNRGVVARYKNVNEINLYQKLRVENNQPFSSSTQIKIQQVGNKAATSPYGNGGYSFDDFKLYNAGKDVSVVSATIKKANCTKTFAAQPLTIKVKNNSSEVISNLPVYYMVNNNPVVNGIIPTININDTVSYVFSTLINYNEPGLYTIKIWTSQIGDNNRINDTLNTTTMIVMETIDSFPYYQDFESTAGNLFSEGTNNSWLWTTPLKYDIDNAAQDNKAWTTGATRGYNFNENSYLYMGCMDFSSLTNDPLISFNFITIMQTLSDSAYIEYSTDGNIWNRLGCYNCGLNWYNGFQNNSYWDKIIFPWQVAHTTVSLAGLSNPSNFMYRLRLICDNFAVSEGIGIDDIHILTDYDIIAVSDSSYVTSASSGNGWIKFIRNGRLVAELHDDNKNLGNVTLGFEANTTKEKQFDNRNIFPRNWVLKSQNSITGNFKLRLYVQNSEYTEFITGEDSISRMGDIGLMRYVGLNTNLDVIDNHVKAYYKYYSPQQIQFYPYQNGYYVELETDTLGEFYLISTKSDANAIQTVNLIDFSAVKINDDVYLEWKTTREINSRDFVIQYSFDANTFIDIDTVPAGGFSNVATMYNYLHQLNATSGIYFYRIKIIDNTNKVSYSLIDSVFFSPNVGLSQNTSVIKAFISGNDIVLEFKNKLNTPARIHIYNTMGQLQFTKQIQLINGIQPLGITDFSVWSKGAYFLQIQTEKQNYYSKLIKQ